MSQAIASRAGDVAQGARARAALPGGAWDRTVAVVKVALPAAAGMLLIAILVWPLTSAREFSFLLSKDKVMMSRERLRTDTAQYRGMTASGEPFTIHAAGAVQRSSAVPVIELRALTADVQLHDGPAQVTAPGGRYEIDHDLLVVAGPVMMHSANGYSVDGDEVRVSLLDHTIATDRPVSGRLPLGTFRANSLRGNIDGRRVMLGGGAHLHIVPAAHRRSA
ncbi:MAG: LPS export ABC transporter periplasmic protein LptC [Sphingomonadaceae bacterium]|nr:LPS export ABC transporter periplasmic protein LptC [Sphingomonadaceae bacterium]